MDPRVSTMTVTTQFPNCELELINVGRYLVIDEIILGIKYSQGTLNVLKGRYLTAHYKKAKDKKDSHINRRLFYNQVSLVMNVNGNCVNVKLFKNGSIHITGCKNVEDGHVAAYTLYNKLIALKGVCSRITLFKNEDNVLMDRDNLVYTHGVPHKIIGHKQNDRYIIHKKDTVIDHKTGMFINVTPQKERKRLIYNLDGEMIGYSKIELLNNRVKFYKKDTNIVKCDGSNDLVYFKDSVLIGRNGYVYDESKVNPDSIKPSSFEVDYDCYPFSDPAYTLAKDELRIYIHCINVYFNMEMMINRQRLVNELTQRKYFCKYTPEYYTGVKLVYFFNELHNTNYICNCTTKCTCTKVTFLIFQTGNVLGTGFRSTDQIKAAVDHFKNLMDTIDCKIRKN
ncbi:hypothetical protein EB118_13710 [bacterium]|nr:hypothetical protein [bacterium]NDD83040.1 hypothetical protein [bacterium]NDG31110.1 hypothetical protein [bacterium]